MNTIKIALIGNVDSGKSTLTSVLVNDGLDDGKGLARKNIFTHPHEKVSGRTSAITMKFTDISNQNFCFIDLCGHEKYLKTTLFGLNLVKPDCCFLMIGANMGVSRMTLQHYLTVAALGFPVVIILTKIDITPLHILKQTIQQMESMCKRIKRVLIECKNPDTIVPISTMIVPYIRTSNVSGEGINMIKSLLGKISNSTKTLSGIKSSDDGGEFLIDNIYNVKGVGLVLSGFVQEGVIKNNDKYLLCLPHSSREVEVSVKSIQDVSDEPIEKLESGQHGTILIKDRLKQLRKQDIRRGNVLLSRDRCELSREFLACIYIFHHQTTIKNKTEKKAGYQCIINCNGIRQSAEFIQTNKHGGILRSHDRCRAKFRFMYHDEYMKPGALFSFREGGTIGVGKVIKPIKK